MGPGWIGWSPVRERVGAELDTTRTGKVPMGGHTISLVIAISIFAVDTTRSGEVGRPTYGFIPTGNLPVRVTVLVLALSSPESGR